MIVPQFGVSNLSILLPCWLTACEGEWGTFEALREAGLCQALTAGISNSLFGFVLWNFPVCIWNTNFSHNIKQLGTCYSSQKENAVNVLLRVFTKYTVLKGKVPLLNQQKKIDFIFCIYIWLFFHLSQAAFSSSPSQVAFPFKAHCCNELNCLWLKSFLRSARYLDYILFCV